MAVLAFVLYLKLGAHTVQKYSIGFMPGKSTSWNLFSFRTIGWYGHHQPAPIAWCSIEVYFAIKEPRPIINIGQANAPAHLPRIETDPIDFYQTINLLVRHPQLHGYPLRLAGFDDVLCLLLDDGKKRHPDIVFDLFYFILVADRQIRSEDRRQYQIV